MAERKREAGFSLLEVMFAAALVTVVIAGCVGAFTSVARNAMPQRARDVAVTIAQNALVRARAAAAYAPNPLPVADAGSVGPYLHSRSWALAIGRRTATISAKLVSAGAICGQSHAVIVPMSMTTDYEEPGSPPVPTFSVSVAYPPNPCAPAVTQSVSMSEELPPVSFVPGTRISRDLVNPPWGQ